jgi:hypothetical protein
LREKGSLSHPKSTTKNMITSSPSAMLSLPDKWREHSCSLIGDGGDNSMDKLKMTGAILAAAVGVLFVTQPVVADPWQAQGNATQVKCIGGNSCKGQSECASKANSCKGQNSCKGKGWITTSSTQQCKQNGGKPQNS